MNRWRTLASSWLMIAAALAAGWFGFGWRGLLVAASAVVFWLLLQFGRTMRVMTNAARSPVGAVRSAIDFHSRLHPGMTMLELVHLTRSLGAQLPGHADQWRWTDPGGDAVWVHLPGGRVAKWRLERLENAPLEAGRDSQPASS